MPGQPLGDVQGTVRESPWNLPGVVVLEKVVKAVDAAVSGLRAAVAQTGFGVT